MSDDVEKRVVELFDDGQFYCAETVLKVLGEASGKDTSEIVKLATGFCSGEARTCGQCGAVSGAVMGIGLYSGRSEPGEDYDACYSLVQEFMERFKEQYDSINCYGLIECDFATKEGQDRFKEKDLKRQCVQYCVFAIETALGLLRENGYSSE